MSLRLDQFEPCHNGKVKGGNPGGSWSLDLPKGESLKLQGARGLRAQPHFVGPDTVAFRALLLNITDRHRWRNPESDTLPAVRSFWRLLLIWLTVLAMPIQGMAAAGGVHCLSASAPASQQAVIEKLHVDQESHAHHSHGPSAQSSADTAEHDEADVPLVHPTSFTVKASTPAHTCSACAACCAGATMPSAAIEVPSPDLSSEPTATVAAEPTSFVVSGPERPPRQVLA